MNRDFDDLEGVVENLDNFQRKNNFKIRGLNEGREGEDLSVYLVELFSSWLGSDFVITVIMSIAYQVGVYRTTQKDPRDDC